MAERTNRLSELPPYVQAEVRRVCIKTCARDRPEWPPCVEKGHACFNCQEHAKVNLEMRAVAVIDACRPEPQG